MEAKKIETPAIEESLTLAVEAIRSDAAQEPGQYLKDAVVPEGGE